MNNESNSISVIIPTFNFPKTFVKVIESLYNQELLPNEIIIVDSTKNDDIKKIVEKYKIKYKNKINLIYFLSSIRLNPGEARNKGFELANCNFISFLDSKTIPKKNWLIENFNLLIKEKLDVVFGNTLYVANDNKNKTLIKDLVYGNIPHVTTPGSILHRDNFNENKFIEGLRTVDDMFWRQKFIKNNYNYSSSNKHNLIYDAIPDSLFSMQKRFFIYSLNLVNVNIQEKTKDLYLALLCILLFLLVPRLNYFYYYLNVELFYLPHITKLFFTLFFFLAFISILLKYFFSYFTKLFLTFYTIIIITFLLSFIFIYNWNYKIVEIIFSSSFYIPHITKIYLIFLFFLHFILRAFILPLRRKVVVFPFRWIKLGLYGITLDYFKSPGLLFGSIFGFKKLFFDKK